MEASRPTNAAFSEPHGRGNEPSRDHLLRSKIGELGLKIEGSRLEPLVNALHAELEAAGIDLKPRVYLSDEWGCPEGVPLIGVPFYLVSEELSKLQLELLENIEAESDAEIMAYLRHETGHAFNYAYRLFESQEWHELFGPYSRPYLDDYVPNPFSRSYVRHIPGWYAQKHPDEDFAESFAVWLTPGLDWRAEYAGWECLPKLEYVERVVAKVGRTSPLVTAADYDESSELDEPLAAYFDRFGYVPEAIPAYFTGDLKRLFHRGEAPSESLSARDLITAQRRAITASISYWTGLSEASIRSLLEHLASEAGRLALWLPRSEQSKCAVELTTYVTALCMNRLYKGEFVVK